MAVEQNTQIFNDNIPVETIDSIAEELKKRFHLRVAHKEELRFIGVIAALEYRTESSESKESFIRRRMLGYAKGERTYYKSTVLTSSMDEEVLGYDMDENAMNESQNPLKISPFISELSEESTGAILEVFLKGTLIDSLDFYRAFNEFVEVIKKEDPEDGLLIAEKLLVLAAEVNGNPSYEGLDMTSTYPMPKEVPFEKRKARRIV